MTALYPGSFDPITHGHIDIIKRIYPLYDQLIVLVGHSTQKKYLFSEVERVELLKECLPELKIKVEAFEGLTVEYAKKANAKVIIRGIRTATDFEFEMTMGHTNKKLAPNIETLVVFASPEYHFISSNLVKEIAYFNGNLSELVPEPVANALRKKFKK